MFHYNHTFEGDPAHERVWLWRRRRYKRKDIEQAIKDLDEWCEAMKAALPIENKAKGD